MRFLSQITRFASYLCFLMAWSLFSHAADRTHPDTVTPDGGRYYGPLANGKLHGRGRLEWDNGARYEGEFENGLFSGRGRLKTGSGQLYEGEFRNGVMSGRGRFEFRDGSIYVGEFRNDFFNGQGRLESTNGRVYEGAFENGEYHGLGRLIGPNRNYQGEFRNGLYWGHGEEVDEEGRKYRGEFVRGRFQGKGRFEYPNGDVYDGDFDKGEFTGKATLVYAKPRHDGRAEDSGIWRYGRLVNEEDERQAKVNVETALYNQRALLDKALASVTPSDAKKINLYLLAVAGDGSQEVFRREVEFVRKQFDREFGTQGRSLALINSRNTVASAPMATMTSIRESLNGIAARMDKKKDILFVFLTSHGSQEHELVLNQNNMNLRGLRARELGELLKEAGIRWKVIVISACYGGGFIDSVKDDRTLVITAARRDRRSFGCADENDFTHFGRAFFKDALPKSRSFAEAFGKAESLIKEWEAKELKAGDRTGENEFSLPQIVSPEPIQKYLDRWWAQK